MPPDLGALIYDVALAFPDSFARLTADQQAGTLRVYKRMLADLAASPHLEPAIVELIQTERRLPTIAAIREAVAERELRLPSEEEALAQVHERIGWGRARDGDPPDVHPLVRRVVDHVGGFYAFRSTEDPGVIRGQFGRLYRDARGQAIRAAQVSAGLPALARA